MNNSFFNITSKAYGSSEWMRFFDKRRYYSSRFHGLIVDGVNRLREDDSFKHMLVVAPTGSGKSTVNIMPFALYAKTESFIATDPSGELHDVSKKYLKKQGYRLRIINVEHPQQSYKFNPLARIRSYHDAQKVSEILIETAFPKGSTSDKFWEDSAKSLILLMILLVCKMDEEKRTMYEVYFWIQKMLAAPEEADRMVSKIASEEEFEEYKSFVAQSEKLRSSVLATAKTALGPFNNPQVRALTASETLCFEDLRKPKTAIFLVVPEHQIRHWSFLISILYYQLFEFLMQGTTNRKLHPVFLLMDEAANCGKIPDLSMLLSTVRKRRVSVELIIQDYTQLNHIYGREDAETIKANCLTKVFFPGLGHQTTVELSQMLGKRTMIHKERGFSGSIQANPEREKEMARELMTPDEIRTMQNRIIVIHGNRKPALLRPKPWYKNRLLRKRAKGL